MKKSRYPSISSIKQSLLYHGKLCFFMLCHSLESRFCRNDTKICKGGTHISPSCRTFATELTIKCKAYGNKSYPHRSLTGSPNPMLPEGEGLMINFRYELELNITE